jgi:nucleoside-diphosphate-sugar epimerase
MNILVTGGLGFIGHNVVRQLKLFNTITVVDNLTNYGILNKDELQSLFNERMGIINLSGIIDPIIGNINDDDILDKAFISNPTTVVHLASFPRAKVVNSNPVSGSEIMMTALVKLLIKCKEHKVKRFVYVSSSMVYGDFDYGVTEDTRCNPFGLYAIMKYSGELIVQDFCKTHNIEYVIVRPSAVYGPRDVEDRVVSKFFANAMVNKDIVVRGENEILDFTYVTDAAMFIALAATSRKCANQTYNITCGEGATLLQAATLIKQITKSTSQIHIDGKDESFPSRGVLSNKKAIIDLQYIPIMSIQNGLTSYYAWLTYYSILRSRPAI